jgi:hypothetical protein
MPKKNRYNKWEIAAFISICSAALYIVAALIAKRKFAIDLPGEFLFLFAAGFSLFGTTGALVKGEFFMQFNSCTREREPISFWTSVVFGYVFTICIIIFFFFDYNHKD